MSNFIVHVPCGLLYSLADAISTIPVANVFFLAYRIAVFTDIPSSVKIILCSPLLLLRRPDSINGAWSEYDTSGHVVPEHSTGLIGLRFPETATTSAPSPVSNI